MLLDPSKAEVDWLAELRREAEAAYGADRVEALDPALQRLSRALTRVATLGGGLDRRSVDGSGTERSKPEARHG